MTVGWTIMGSPKRPGNTHSDFIRNVYWAEDFDHIMERWAWYKEALPQYCFWLSQDCPWEKDGKKAL